MREKKKLIMLSSDEKNDVYDLYKSLVGMPFCAWTDDYPGMKEIEYDLKRDALYGVRIDGVLAGVISRDLDFEVEEISCWSRDDGMKPVAEISRVGVRKDYQNIGMAGFMVTELMKELKAQGYRAVHYIVAKDNVKALKAYEKLGFSKVGDTFYHGINYWCYEKKL